MNIHYVTGNRKKFEEGQLILKGWHLEQVELDLKAIQGDHIEVIKAKAQEAQRLLNKPLIVEDIAVCCPAIGGLPGPYVKDFLKKMGDKGFCELVHKYQDHTAKVICIAAYATPEKPTISTFEGVIEGTIVPPRGHTKHGQYSWNPIFQPKGHNKTFGEMTLEEHSQISMRKTALLLLKQHLEKA